MRRTVAGAASPGAGSGSGTLLSGLVVQFLPAPRQTIYLLLAAILAIQALFVLRDMPRGPRHPLSCKAVSPRVAVPSDAKTTFMSHRDAISLHRLNGRAQTIIGAVAMLIGLGITVAAIESRSTWLYLVASAVAGTGFGAGFQGPVRSMAPQTADDQRGTAADQGAGDDRRYTHVATGLAAALAVLTAPRAVRRDAR